MSAGPARIGPIFGLLYASTFWGLVWYPTRLLEQSGVQGAWLTLVGYGVAFAAFAPFVRIDRGRIAQQAWETVSLVLAAGWTNVAFVLAVLEGEVVRVVLLFYLSPLWTVLLGRWLLHEPLGLRTLVMLGFGLGGSVVMLWDPAIGRVPLNRADLLALSAGFAFAINNVMTRRITVLGVRGKTFAAWFGVVVVSLLVIGVTSPGLPDAPGLAWLGVVMLGLLGFLASTLAVTYGVSHMPVQRSSVIMLFELIVGAASAWWLANEAVTAQEWIGGALILAAALIAIFKEEPAA
ncbi:MAG: DMT family transporter [Gammaproteobacteria bacterium]|nr:DMT family transporter [Gammaproteobacteria bacterium]MCP5298934.1 DMT family transporter [Chromatiaceae bacterium]